MPIGVAIVLLTVAHFLDYASFVAMIARHGLEAELNPLVVLIFEKLGLIGVTLAKVAAVGLAASVAVVLIQRRGTLAGIVLGFGIASGLIGAFSNVISL